MLLAVPDCLLPVPEADALVIEPLEEPDDEPDDEPLDEEVAEAEDDEPEAMENAIDQSVLVRCCPCSFTYKF